MDGHSQPADYSISVTLSVYVGLELVERVRGQRFVSEHCS